MHDKLITLKLASRQFVLDGLDTQRTSGTWRRLRGPGVVDECTRWRKCAVLRAVLGAERSGCAGDAGQILNP